MCEWCHHSTPIEEAEMARQRRLAAIWDTQHDDSAGLIDTPMGQARFVGYDQGSAVVELPIGLVMEFAAEACFVVREG